MTQNLPLLTSVTYCALHSLVMPTSEIQIPFKTLKKPPTKLCSCESLLL